MRRRIDDGSYSIRFTPRQRRSIWSAINVKRVGELAAEGLMRPAGLAAFERRSGDRTGIYSYERAAGSGLRTRAGARASRPTSGPGSWFQEQAPSYRRAATHWVISAKKPETRERRLRRLIEDSAAGRTVPPLTRPS